MKEPIVVSLGDTARDTITGFEGVVVCLSQWLHGCRRVTLQPQKLHEGKPVECQSFDEPQLELLRSSVVPTTALTGGPRLEPVRGR
jgi:hypothetical protein